MEIGTSSGPARVELDEPARPAFLLAVTHGAGGRADAPDLLAVCAAAAALNAAVARVTQPYRLRGARAPGSAVRQDAAWLEIIAALRARIPGIPLVLCGRSNGARVACRTARAAGARAAVALAFPLHPPGRPAASRVAELRAAGVPVLVVNGDRDPFGVPAGPDASKIVVMPGESHALSRNPAVVGDAVASWLREILKFPAGGTAGPRGLCASPAALYARPPASAAWSRAAQNRSAGAVRSCPRRGAAHRCPRS